MALTGLYVIAEDIDDPDDVLLADRPADRLDPRGMVLSHRIGRNGTTGPHPLQAMLANGSWTDSDQDIVPVDVDARTLETLRTINDSLDPQPS